MRYSKCWPKQRGSDTDPARDFGRTVGFRSLFSALFWCNLHALQSLAAHNASSLKVITGYPGPCSLYLNLGTIFLGYISALYVGWLRILTCRNKGVADSKSGYLRLGLSRLLLRRIFLTANIISKVDKPGHPME